MRHSLLRWSCVGALFALTSLSQSSPAIAQKSLAPPTAETTWRPKDGLYDTSTSDRAEPCSESSFLLLELGDKSVSGNEWGCEIGKLSYTAPGAIRLDLTCHDYNLAEHIGDRDPENRVFKEVLLLRKIDGKSISVRKTVNGKFDGPSYPMSYCPATDQKNYQDEKARK